MKLYIKPKGRKSWIAERHHKLMRIQLRKMEMQIHKDKLVFLLKDFEHVIAEAVFSKNCLLSLGEGTPYSALYGQVPR